MKAGELKRWRELLKRSKLDSNRKEKKLTRDSLNFKRHLGRIEYMQLPRRGEGEEGQQFEVSSSFEGHGEKFYSSHVNRTNSHSVSRPLPPNTSLPSINIYREDNFIIYINLQYAVSPQDDSSFSQSSKEIDDHQHIEMIMQ